MAVDTAQKRASAISAYGGLVALHVPSAIDSAGERRQIADSYLGEDAVSGSGRLATRRRRFIGAVLGSKPRCDGE